MRDIREVIDTWYIVVEGKGYEIGDWDDTLLEVERRVKDNPGKSIVTMSEKEWRTRNQKEDKRVRD